MSNNSNELAGYVPIAEAVKSRWSLTDAEIESVRQVMIEGGAWQLLELTMDTAADRSPSTEALDDARKDAAALSAAVPVEVARLLGELRALHSPVEVEPSGTICSGCSTSRGEGPTMRFFPFTEWPCETIAVLDTVGVPAQVDEAATGGQSA